MTLDVFTIVFFAVCGIAGVLIGAWLFRRDEAREDRDFDRVMIAADTREMKLPRICEIMARFAIRDWSGLFRCIKNLREEAAKGKAAILAMLYENFFDYQLPERMLIPEQRARIVQMVADLNVIEEAAEAKAREKLVKELLADPDSRKALKEQLATSESVA